MSSRGRILGKSGHFAEGVACIDGKRRAESRTNREQVADKIIFVCVGHFDQETDAPKELRRRVERTDERGAWRFRFTDGNRLSPKARLNRTVARLSSPVRIRS